MSAMFMRRLLYLTLAAGVAVVSGVPGTAMAAPPTLQVAPSSVIAGSSVHVTGTCEPNSVGYAISPAFLHDANHDFAGVGAAHFSTDAAGAFAVDAQIPASMAPGAYSVTARCGGGNLGISASLTVTAHGGTPTGVPAGSGGHAAATRAGQHDTELLLGGAGLLLVAGGAVGLARLRRPARA